MCDSVEADTTFTIKDARVFDGRTLISADTAGVENGLIRGVSRALKPEPAKANG
jgi:hypothetical protein